MGEDEQTSRTEGLGGSIIQVSSWKGEQAEARKKEVEDRLPEVRTESSCQCCLGTNSPILVCKTPCSMGTAQGLARGKHPNDQWGIQGPCASLLLSYCGPLGSHCSLSLSLSQISKRAHSSVISKSPPKLILVSVCTYTRVVLL